MFLGEFNLIHTLVVCHGIPESVTVRIRDSTLHRIRHIHLNSLSGSGGINDTLSLGQTII